MHATWIHPYALHDKLVFTSPTGAYRERLIVLDEYSATHDIPPALMSDMKGHLKLHFSNAEMQDESVLSVYPTTIRRRILRHLYNYPLHTCWLFRGCKQKFVDALLLSAKVELFMPKVWDGASWWRTW